MIRSLENCQEEADQPSWVSDLHCPQKSIDLNNYKLSTKRDACRKLLSYCTCVYAIPLRDLKFAGLDPDAKIYRRSVLCGPCMGSAYPLKSDYVYRGHVAWRLLHVVTPSCCLH